MEIPAVSVIIPMYNAEKYIGECLDSLLAQTLQNYEVIVVNDCSTDNSVAVVKSYVEKFDGRLTLTQLEKNSGNAGYTARNEGFEISQGEYVFFMDADDMLTKNALEILYTSAKKFDADVVYTGARYLYTTERGAMLQLDAVGFNLRKNGLEDKPLLIVNDPQKNLEQIFQKDGFWTAWTRFTKRTLLIENRIKFCEIMSSGDYIWVSEVSAYAKRFLRIPNAVYFWRDDSENSMTRKKEATAKQIVKWSEAFLDLTKGVADLRKRNEIIKENPVYCYLLLLRPLDLYLMRNLEARFQVSSEEVYEILRRALESKGESDLLIPALFAYIDYHQKNYLALHQKSNEFSAQVDQCIAELEKAERQNRAYVLELKRLLADSQRRVAELQNEIIRSKIKE